MSPRAPKTPVKMRNLRTKSVDAQQAKAVKGGIALLLPAVQAARESARR